MFDMVCTISRDVLPSCRFLGTISSLAATLSFSQSLDDLHGPGLLLLSGVLQGLSIDDLGGSCPHRLMLLAHPGAVGMTCTSRRVLRLIGAGVIGLFVGLVLRPVESDLQVSLVVRVRWPLL